MSKITVPDLDWMHQPQGTGEPKITLDEFKIQLAGWAAEDGVEASVVADRGPTDWPVVRIQGERDAVRRFLVERYLGGEARAADPLNGLASLVGDYGLSTELL